MSDNDNEARIMQIEKRLTLAEQQISGHERECAVRYKNLDTTMTEMKAIISETKEMVSQGRGGIKALIIIGGLLTLVLTLMKLGNAL